MSFGKAEGQQRVESACEKKLEADIQASCNHPHFVKSPASCKAELRNFMAILRTGGSVSGAACHQVPFFDVQCLACSIPTTTLLRTPTRISIPSVISLICSRLGLVMPIRASFSSSGNSPYFD